MSELSQLISEGQQGALRHLELSAKLYNGGLSEEETDELSRLNGKLTAMAQRAQELGFGTHFDLPETIDNQLGNGDEDEDEYEQRCYECGEEGCYEDCLEEEDDWY